MLSAREVQYILSIAEKGAFSKAAQACHISQPSLSAQIKKVEERLGLPLFIRTKKGVSLTSFGERVLPHIQEIQKQYNAIQADAYAMCQTPKRPVRMGIIPTVGPYLLPKMKGGAAYTFTEAPTQNLIELLLKDEMDAAIVALPLMLPQFETMKLYREPFYLAGAAENPHLMHVDLEQGYFPEGCRLLILSEEHCMGEQTAKLCQLNLAHRNDTFKATSLETLRHMVSDSLDVTLIPESAKREGDGLTYRSLPSKFYREIGVIYKATSARRGDVVAFRDFI